MSMPFEVRNVDRQFYRSRLSEFLPERMVDVHTHVWRAPRAARSPDAPTRTVTWPGRVADANPIEDLLESYRRLLPEQAVTPVIFPSPTEGLDLDAANDYVAESAAHHTLPALVLAHPSWDGEELEQRILFGGFVGAKVYLTFAPDYLPADEIRIFDFLPPQQLRVLDRRGWIAMLHIPRPGRLRDPVNIAQLLEIEQRFPNVGLIVAHVGRAYCPQDVGDAFERLAGTRRMRFDISANTCEEVFRRLIGAVGPGRILFGSDLPITRMRMRRVCENGRYVNLVPRGLYGDVSADAHMRELDGAEADALTFFLYEQLDAFRRAAEGEGLTRADIASIFRETASGMIERAGAGRGSRRIKP